MSSRGTESNGRSQLPGGTVTLLFTDIAGSTVLLQKLGDRYATLLAEHHFILRQAFQAHGGIEVDNQGDAFFVAFNNALDAVRAACTAQRNLSKHNWPEQVQVRVRIGIHTGEPVLVNGSSYVGLDVHRGARLCAAGHGGQVLLSHAAGELVQRELPPGTDLRDRGEHRLKDLQHPEHIFELVIDDLPFEFPPLRTLTARPNNLPAQATPLVGREAEVPAIQQRLLREDVRLLTLTGPGGTGKTRLSLQIGAEMLEHFASGVFFVQLANITDPELVPSAITRALGVHEQVGRPVLESLIDFLRDKQLLLVLDNFEQVMSAAPLVGELLEACQRLKVLVTSREVLHLYGEHDFAVQPLAVPARQPLPPLDRLVQYDAFRLFVERAQAVKADFAVTARTGAAVVEICHRVDGLPLGIELAAARVRVLPPEAMLQRMDRRLPLLTGGPRDKPPRHQTLRNAIAWSFDLLSEDEQALFRRLPVFSGGCTLEAAEAICGGWETGIPSQVPRGIESPTPDARLLSPIDVLSGIESLLDKSLVREEHTDGDAAEPRLLMLETIREYGLERLDASGEGAEVRRRHAMYYMQLAENAEPKLHGPDQVLWLDRLEAENGNLRAVLAWSTGSPEAAEIGLRLGGALLWFWVVRGYFGEGGRALQAVLASSPNANPAVRAKALLAAGHLAQYERDFARSLSLLEESIRISRGLHDEEAHARALSLLGETARVEGDLDRATAVLQEALAMQRRLSDRWGTYHTLHRLGEAARNQGDFDRAEELHSESLALRQDMRDFRGIGAAYQSLGLLALGRGDFVEAQRVLRDALAHHRLTRNRFGTAMCLEGLVDIALARNDLVHAARLVGGLESVLEAIGVALLMAERARFDRNRVELGSRMDERQLETIRAEGRAMDVDEAIEYALSERA